MKKSELLEIEKEIEEKFKALQQQKIQLEKQLDQNTFEQLRLQGEDRLLKRLNKKTKTEKEK